MNASQPRRPAGRPAGGQFDHAAGAGPASKLTDTRPLPKGLETVQAPDGTWTVVGPDGKPVLRSWRQGRFATRSGAEDWARTTYPLLARARAKLDSRFGAPRPAGNCPQCGNPLVEERAEDSGRLIAGCDQCGFEVPRSSHIPGRRAY